MARFLYSLFVAFSIDDDILNMVDEVDLDKFLNEASEAMDNPEVFSQFLREKATIAIERFLVSLLLPLLNKFVYFWKNSRLTQI